MKLEKLDVIISADDFTTLKNTAELNEKYIDSISFELKN